MWLLQTSKGHLCSRNVLLWVLQVLEHGVVVPGDALVDVGGGVGVTSSLASLATKDAVEVRSDLVWAALGKEYK